MSVLVTTPIPGVIIKVWSTQTHNLKVVHQKNYFQISSRILLNFFKHKLQIYLWQEKRLNFFFNPKIFEKSSFMKCFGTNTFCAFFTRIPCGYTSWHFFHSNVEHPWKPLLWDSVPLHQCGFREELYSKLFSFFGGRRGILFFWWGPYLFPIISTELQHSCTNWDFEFY